MYKYHRRCLYELSEEVFTQFIIHEPDNFWSKYHKGCVYYVLANGDKTFLQIYNDIQDMDNLDDKYKTKEAIELQLKNLLQNNLVEMI